MQIKYTLHDPYNCPCDCVWFYSLEQLLDNIDDEDCHKQIISLHIGEHYESADGMVIVSRHG
jgi:hypothetical protein